MKKIDCLTRFNRHLFEVRFLKEILCGTGKKSFLTSSEIGTPSGFRPRGGNSSGNAVP